MDCISKLDVVEFSVEIGQLPTDASYGLRRITLIGNYVPRRSVTPTLTADIYAALAVRYPNIVIDVGARTRKIAIEKA